MKFSFKTKCTCCQVIVFYINDFLINNVKFLGGGCPGNLQAVSKLVNGMEVEKIEEKLSGILCGNKGTSCADQLYRAIKEISKGKTTLI